MSDADKALTAAYPVNHVSEALSALARAYHGNFDGLLSPEALLTEAVAHALLAHLHHQGEPRVVSATAVGATEYGEGSETVYRDDGTVFSGAWHHGEFTWSEMEPVPGTRRARERQAGQ